MIIYLNSENGFIKNYCKFKININKIQEYNEHAGIPEFISFIFSYELPVSLTEANKDKILEKKVIYKYPMELEFLFKNYKASILDLNKYISLTKWSDPFHEEAIDNRGSAKKQLGLYAEAIKDYNEIIEFNETSAYAYKKRGNSFYLLGFFKEAIEDYDMDSKYSGLPYQCRYVRGMANYKLGFYREAIEDFEESEFVNVFGDDLTESEINDFYKILQICYSKIGSGYSKVPATKMRYLKIPYASWNSTIYGNNCCINDFALRVKNELPIKVYKIEFDLIIYDKKGDVVYRKTHTVNFNGLKENEVVQSEYFDLENQLCLPCSYINSKDFSWTKVLTGVYY